jgi:hypothetical protein
MFEQYVVLSLFVLLLYLHLGPASGWMSYIPVTFVGNISEIYSNMPVFHGYTSDFLNNPQVKQVCHEANNDDVRLDYCNS